MLDPNYMALVVHILDFLGGLAGSLFLLVVNLNDWLKARNLVASDLLISSLGLSNLGVQCVLAVSIYCYLVSRGVYSLDHVSKPFFILRMFVFSTSLWCATCLGVYSCVKIVNFSQRLLDSLKANISKMCPWMLLGSVLLSLALSLPAIWDISREEAGNSTLRNATVAGVFFQSRCACIFTIYIVGCSMAFAVFSVAALLLITSLCRHVRRMGQNGGGFGNPHRNVHVRAIKLVTSVLVLYAALFASAVLIISSTVLPGDPWYVVCSVVGCTAPSLLPVILILGNNRLKRTLSGLLFCGKCCPGELVSGTSTG